jgi:hypothetical protein
MFKTFGRTLELIKLSWGVLQSDRKLIAFPLLSGFAFFAFAGLMTGIGSQIGLLGRLESEAGLAPSDIGVLGITYFGLAFVIIYFNAALAGAAMVRLAGGQPTMGEGFQMANRRLPQIAGWALIAATVGLILQVARSRSRDNFLGQLVLSMIGGVWAYITFFVVPVLVAENLGPIAAIRRSGSLFKRTWGEQMVANFGFGLVGLVAVIAAVVPAMLIAQVSVVAGIVVGVVTVGFAVATVSTLETIFKAALYGYVADGRVAEGFTQDALSGAYGN